MKVFFMISLLFDRDKSLNRNKKLPKRIEFSVHDSLISNHDPQRLVEIIQRPFPSVKIDGGTT